MEDEKGKLPEYEEMLESAYAALPEKAKKEERFERPTFEAFIQGNKTIVRNFIAVAQKLRRKPAFFAKYLSRELAVPSSQEGGRLILQGRFYERQLNEKLEVFIKTYVLCKECKKPDTRLVDEGGVLMIICEACGARAPAGR